MSEATFLSLSSGDTYIEASNNFDPDAESDIEDILFEGSADMGNSGDGPCVDRSFVSRYLYRCLGEFMQASYEAKINQVKPNKRKMCALFESGFQCFEQKVEQDFGVQCTSHDMFDTAQWFKQEVYQDFSIDIRRCPYPERPHPTTISPTTSDKPGDVFPVTDTPQTALVAGLVLGGAVLFICSLLVFIICKRRINCSCSQDNENQAGKNVPKRASVNLSAASGSACGINDNRAQGNLQQQCAVNMADTRSTLTGLSSDGSGHLNIPGYEHHIVRPQSSHIYSEINDTVGMDTQRVAPIGCSTLIAGSATPINSYLNSHEVMPAIPRGMTVEYLQNGGYLTHAQSNVYAGFNTDQHYLTMTPHQSPIER